VFGCSRTVIGNEGAKMEGVACAYKQTVHPSTRFSHHLHFCQCLYHSSPPTNTTSLMVTDSEMM
jgi:hypothetical protein